VKRYAVIGSLVVLVLLATPVAAQEELPSPGITPDSWLYVFDRAFEWLQKLFAFTPEAKARLALELAAERLAEALEMDRRGKPEFAARIAEDYVKEMDEAKRYGEAIAEAATQRDIKEVISRATSIHLAVLEKINPDNPLYPCKRKAEDVGIDVALTLEEKAKRQLDAAGRRAEEAKAMADKGRAELVRQMVEDYEEQLNKAVSYGEALAEQAKKKDFEILVAEATSIHIDVLEGVLEKVPEHAKPVIKRAIDTSKREHEESLNRLGEVDPLKAVELQLKFAEKMLERAKEKVDKGRIEEAEELFEEYQAKVSKALEMIDIAKEAGMNITEITEKVVLATSKHLETLQEVHVRVPEEAKAAIERAIEVSAEGQEKALEALRKAERPEEAKETEEEK